MTSPARRYRFGKRTVDIFGAVVGLVVTLPLQIVAAVIIRLRLGSPIFFRQTRPGLGGRTFTLIKFRTMLEPSAGAPLAEDSERMTDLGRFLRSASLDELPSLWNVFRGDMSLVGPRPLLVEYLPLYTAEQRGRHEVRPGITGLAQVSGRNGLDWPKRLALDVAYVDNCSACLDVRILIRTVLIVLRREGVSQPGHATVQRFEGVETAR